MYSSFVYHVVKIFHDASLFITRLHAVAADLAIKATKQFFEDIRSAVGDDMFARLLNLQAVRTLALVIDDTGSMGSMTAVHSKYKHIYCHYY